MRHVFFLRLQNMAPGFPSKPAAPTANVDTHAKEDLRQHDAAAADHHHRATVVQRGARDSSAIWIIIVGRFFAAMGS